MNEENTQMMLDDPASETAAAGVASLESGREQAAAPIVNGHVKGNLRQPRNASLDADGDDDALDFTSDVDMNELGDEEDDDLGDEEDDEEDEEENPNGNDDDPHGNGDDDGEHGDDEADDEEDDGDDGNEGDDEEDEEDEGDDNDDEDDDEGDDDEDDIDDEEGEDDENEEDLDDNEFANELVTSSASAAFASHMRSVTPESAAVALRSRLQKGLEMGSASYGQDGSRFGAAHGCPELSKAEQAEIGVHQEASEEYKTWKKNTVFLYDLLVTQAFEWPSLTVQWLPDVEIPEDKDYTCHRLLLGTHTSNYEQNYLQIAQVMLPRQDVGPEASKLNDDTNEYGGYGTKECKITITQRIPHSGEVNRARYMPQKPDIIATKSVSGEVFVFDRTRYASEPQPGFVQCIPTVRLTGHSSEGYGLCWSSIEKGIIASSADDQKICVWDLKAADQGQSTLAAQSTYEFHEAGVGDVSWHKREANIFASVDDSGMLFVWDRRVSPSSGPTHRVRAHEKAANCVDFNPCTMFLLATGSVDSRIKIWDLRATQNDLHTLEGHDEDVIQLNWHPQHGHILSSSSRDRRVMLWDLSRVGEDQNEEDAEDGVPELLFTHGGHTDPVSDFSWNQNLPWTVASVADDNVIQIWQPASPIYNQDFDEDLPCEPSGASS